jgi:hypothetical protein
MVPATPWLNQQPKRMSGASLSSPQLWYPYLFTAKRQKTWGGEFDHHKTGNSRELPVFLCLPLCEALDGAAERRSGCAELRRVRYNVGQ